ncbi:MAG: hypothetical protein ACRCS5_11695 [Sphingomonas sp.]
MKRPQPGWRSCAMVVLVVFAALTTMVALRMPYPSTFDELPHVSVVRAQYEHPAPFADASTYRMVSRDDLARWTTASNYINHPPLYYMMIGQMLRVTSDVYALRLANVVLALVALAIGLWAGVRYLGAGGDRTVFVILIACFPKAPLIGGIVNNDNLANIAAVIVFVGLTGAGGGAWLLGIGLALAGWTKLTALVSLGTAVIIARGWPLMRGRRAWRFADLWPIALGGAVGALPYLVNYARTGHLLYVNEALYGVPLADRPQIYIQDYAVFFFATLADKWPAAEFQLPVVFSAILALAPVALAALGSRADRRIGAIGWPFLAAFGVTLVIHFWFGWSAFQRIGDQSIAQSRYYAVLWPGIALAATPGIRALAQWWRPLAVLAMLMILIPTVPGGAITALLLR